MTPQQAAPTIQAYYRQVLGRPADNDGLVFWSNEVASGRRSFDDVRWEFVTVRFAADKAAFLALVAKVADPRGTDPGKIAEQTYRLFLDDLAALGAK